MSKAIRVLSSLRLSACFSVRLLGGAAGTLVLLAPSAWANRPLIRTPNALRNIRMAAPVAFESVIQKELLGLDQDDAASRGTVLRQAEEYISLRGSQLSKNDALTWYANCQAQGGLAKASNNPFCNYELERKIGTIAKIINSTRHDHRSQLATELLNADYRKLAQYNHGEVIGAMNQLDLGGHLDSVAKNMVTQKDCKVPSMATWAVAYKLEERFPAPESIDLVTRLYRQSVDCGADVAAANSAYRLALIRISQEKCEEVPELMHKVEGVPAASQYHARAQYWRYYCAEENDDETGKGNAKAALMKNHPMSFQALAVSGDDDTAMSQVLRNQTPQVALRSLVRPDLNAMIRGSEALMKKGAGRLAAEMLDHSTRDIATVEPEVRLYLAVLLNRLDATLPKFRILTELFQDSPKSVNEQTLRLFFPLSYYELVRTKGGQVDPLLILSLIRQESAFNKDARSIVGARGLMQVMPKTARLMASVRSSQKLLDPATNIGVGTKYFTKRLEQYGGDVELTLAAYNAGFGRVAEWKKRYPTDNKMLFLDLIPFRETRDYVSAILRNYYWYVKLYAQPGVEQAKTNAPSQNDKFLAIMSANAGAAAAGAPLTADRR